MENKFKVGDKVQLIDYFLNYKKGEIFEAVPADRMNNTGVWIERGKVLCYESAPAGIVDVNDRYNREMFVLVQSEDFELTEKKEMVQSPSHYDLFPGIEAIQVIASSLTVEEYRGYCLGNLLKYRLRCGKKDNVGQELAKADRYVGLFEEYKHLCKDK